MSGASAQVSNSLGAQPDVEVPDAAPGTDDGTFYYEPVLFKPDEIRAIVEGAGLPIIMDEAIPELDGYVIVASLYGLPLAYGFSDCFEQGCTLLIQAHKAPTTVRGLRTTPQVVNQLNPEFPLGQLIADENGDMVYRAGLPATPGCAIDCVEVHLRLYLLALNEIYRLLNETSSRNEASLSSGLALSAAMTRLPEFASLVSQAGGTVGIGNFGNPVADFAGREPGAADLSRLLELSGLGEMANELPVDDWSALTGN
nr:hypothetical protein GCM10011355_23570 [Aquisalinus luteolus]